MAPIGFSGQPGEQSSVDPAGCPRSSGGGSAEQIGDPTEAVGLLAEDSFEHRDVALLPGLEDGVRLVICHPAATAGTTSFGLKQPNAAATISLVSCAHARAATCEA
jgi:hypothetical protein